MFVVSTQTHPAFDEHFEVPDAWIGHAVKRYYSFGQLAHLLNGHSSEWLKRLPDFAHMQFFDDVPGPLNGRRLIKNAVDSVFVQHRHPNFIAPSGFAQQSNQLHSTSLMLPAIVTEDHHHDCITYAVEETWAQGVGSATHYKNKPMLILFEAEDAASARCDPEKVAKYIVHDRCWYGKEMLCSRHAHDQWYCPVDPAWPLFFFRRPCCFNDHPVRATDLSIALGLYSDPDQAEVWGVVSLFKHYGGKYELLEEEKRLGPRQSQRREEQMAAWRPYFYKFHHWSMSEETLTCMARLALAANKHFSSQGSAPRMQRGAAAKAIQAMHRCAHTEAPPETAQEDEKEKTWEPVATKKPKRARNWPHNKVDVCPIARFAALMDSDD